MKYGILKNTADYLITSLSTSLKEVEKCNVLDFRIGKDSKFSSNAIYGFNKEWECEN